MPHTAAQGAGSGGQRRLPLSGGKPLPAPGRQPGSRGRAGGGGAPLPAPCGAPAPGSPPAWRVRRVGGGYDCLEDAPAAAAGAPRGRPPPAASAPPAPRTSSAAAAPLPPRAASPARSSRAPTRHDLEVVREVILAAEARARRDYARGRGGAREVTLLQLLRAYEQARAGCDPRVCMKAPEQTAPLRGAQLRPAGQAA